MPLIYPFKGREGHHFYNFISVVRLRNSKQFLNSAGLIYFFCYKKCITVECFILAV